MSVAKSLEWAYNRLIQGEAVPDYWSTQFRIQDLRNLAYELGYQPMGKTHAELWHIINVEQDTAPDDDEDIDLGDDDKDFEYMATDDYDYDDNFVEREPPAEAEMNTLCGQISAMNNGSTLLLVNPYESVTERRTRLIRDGVSADLIDLILAKYTKP